MTELTVTRWANEMPFSEETALSEMENNTLNAYKWSNGPHVRYAEHTHHYHKVIYCVQGSIRFTLPDTERQIRLIQGDRLDLPAHTLHGAIVGAAGVTCLEGHRR